MSIFSVAMIYGLAMFAIASTTAALLRAVVTVVRGLEFDAYVLWLLFRKSMLAGALTGVPSVLVAYFGTHRKIGGG